MAVLVVAGHGALPADPAGAAVPPTDAPADTWRGRTEAWVGTRLFPALLGRTGSSADRRTLAHRAVLTSPGDVARAVAATPESRRRQAGIAYAQGLARPASTADREYWAGRLAADWSHDRMVSHLLGSAEASGRHPSDRAWIAWAFQQILGRAPDAAGTSYWEGRLRAGTVRSFAARQVLASGEARQRVISATWPDVVSRAPSATERTYGQALLKAFDGDPQRLRAELVTSLAPAGYTVGVMGDSVAFDMVFRTSGVPLPAVVTGGRRPVGAGRLGCAVLSDRVGYRWPRDPQLATNPPGASWGAPADGRCPEELPRLERAVLDARPQVLIWPIGAWEWTRVMRPNGTIIAERSTPMREEVASAMVRRIDGWVSRGTVRKVILPEWACVGPSSAAIFRHPGYTRFVRSVLAEVVRRRPAIVSIAATPPEVCVNGDAEGQPTAAHRAARGNQFHWVAGHNGAAWGWRMWFAPAVADLRGVS